MSGRARGVLLAALLAGGLPLGAEAAGTKTRTRAQCSGQVNLNQATVAQLDLLPGVGQKAAERIVTHRQKRPFMRIEELVRVKGFGKKRFLQLKPCLTLQGETNLRVERLPAG